MLSVPLLLDLLDHSYWARDRQLDVCERLSPDDLNTPMQGSFGSLRGTLVHLLAAERLWLARWQSQAPTRLEPVDFHDIAQLREEWRRTEGQFRDYAATLSDAALAAPFTYARLNGERCTYPLWQTKVHFMNHQSYHRGQVTLLLRQLGSSATGVDYLHFVDSVSL